MKKFSELQIYDAYKYLIYALVAALVAIFSIGMTVEDVISSAKTPVDINGITSAECKTGTHVTGDVHGTLGYYWESYTTHNGIKQRYSTERIYLIPFGTEGKYIGLNVHQYDFEKFDALEDATYDALLGVGDAPEPLTGYEGYIKKCDARMIDALEEAYTSIGGTEDPNEVFVPYYIEQSSGESMVMVLLGLVFLIAAVILFVVFLIKLKKEEEMVGNQVYLGKIIFDRNDYIAQREPETYDAPEPYDTPKRYDDPESYDTLKRYDDSESYDASKRYNDPESYDTSKRYDEPESYDTPKTYDVPETVHRDSEYVDVEKNIWDAPQDLTPEAPEEKKSGFSLRMKSDE